MNEDYPQHDAFPAYRAAWPTAPAGFADRVTAAALAVHRSRRRRVWFVRAGGLALAASVALGVAVGFDAFRKPPAEVVAVPPTPAPAPKIEKVEPIQKPFAEAGEAIAAITRKTTDKALAPSKTMIAGAERIPMPTPVEAKAPDESTGFADAAEGAIIGLDPVAGQPRRAVNRMFRDFGIAPSKPRS